MDIQTSVNDTNIALENSGIDVSIRLVGMVEEDYVESGDLGPHFRRLEMPGDGFLDDAQSLRDKFGAGSVTGRFETHFRNNGGMAVTWGIGSELSSLQGNKNSAFSVIADTGTQTYLLAHEIGHNFGVAHAVGDPQSAGVTSYAHGYRFTGTDGQIYHDIMAYAPVRRFRIIRRPTCPSREFRSAMPLRRMPHG